MKITREMMKSILQTMFEGWIKREDSWTYTEEIPYGTYLLSEEDAMQSVCEDKEIAELLVLFSHWGWDIISIAAQLGIGIDGNKVVEVQPPPDPSYFWFEGKWLKPMNIELDSPAV